MFMYNSMCSGGSFKFWRKYFFHMMVVKFPVISVFSNTVMHIALWKKYQFPHCM